MIRIQFKRIGVSVWYDRVKLMIIFLIRNFTDNSGINGIKEGTEDIESKWP